MHSIVKNLSKVLALAVLSANFSPSFVSATKTRRNPKAPNTHATPKSRKTTKPKSRNTKAKAPHKKLTLEFRETTANDLNTKGTSEVPHTTGEPVDAISADEMSEDERLFREQIDTFKGLGQGWFKVAEDFKTQDNYKNAYLMLKQLNGLFDKYPKVLNALIKYAEAHGCFYLNKVSPTAHQVTAPPHPLFLYRLPFHPNTTASVADPYSRFMLFNAPTPLTDAAIIRNSTTGVNARVDDDKYLQAIVSSLFGKLMFFLKCLNTYYYFAINNGTNITPQVAATLEAMHDAHSQRTREDIAHRFGYAPYISHVANNQNPFLPTAPLLPGGELSESTAPKVTDSYFAELFVYTECNSQAPAKLKTAVREIIDTWFK